MLASIPEFREVDFSHLTLTDTALESDAPVRKQQWFLVWIALLLSLLLHLSLLIFEFDSNQMRTSQASTQTLKIDLLPAPTKTLDVIPEVVIEEIVELQPVPDVVKENIVPSVAAKKIVSAEKPHKVQSATRLVLEPLSAQELTEITTSHNAQPDYENDPPIVKNVFHPELRKKLIAASKEHRKKRVEDEDPAAGYIDPAGAVRVETGMGTCLSSPQDNRVGAPKNWYVSLCKGKTESEEMMERVNREVKEKFRFDE